MPNANATEKQIAFINRLLDERDLFASSKFFDACNAMDAEEFAQYLAALKTSAAGISKQNASAWISRLMELPKKAGQHVATSTQAAPTGKVTVRFETLTLDDGKERVIGLLQVPGQAHEVPAGRYAIETPGPEFRNELSFFKVWVGNRGGWNVKIHGSDETFEMTFPKQLAILAAIAVNPAAASARYGEHFEHCGVCGRGLTADVSREIGIGPVCRARFGW